MRSFRAASRSVVVQRLLVHGRLFGQSEGVDESARGGRGSRAKVEYPEEIDHGQEDETSGGSLSRGAVSVNQAVNGGSNEHMAGSSVGSESDMIGLNSIASNNDENARVEQQGVEDGPPSKFGERTVSARVFRIIYLSKNSSDKGNEPGELEKDLVRCRY